MSEQFDLDRDSAPDDKQGIEQAQAGVWDGLDFIPIKQPVQTDKDTPVTIRGVRYSSVFEAFGYLSISQTKRVIDAGYPDESE